MRILRALATRHSATALLVAAPLFATAVSCQAPVRADAAGALPAVPTAGVAGLNGSTPTVEAPGLLVLLVVDQLRADLLDRYAEVFSHGLARLQDEGFRFTRATHDHATTLTAPGHASIATGTLPSRHGVVANAWYEMGDAGWEVVENVLDRTVALVDDPALAGASPSVMNRSTLAEWLQDADEDARVVSVSAKARASVTMAGRSRSTTLWFDDLLGRFVTSRAYAEEYPGWVEDFNQEVLPGMAGDWVWEIQVPEEFRPLARRDEAYWEGDGVHTTFPHRWEDSGIFFEENLPWAWWAMTPPLDRATRLLAQEAAEQEELGQDGVTDLLAISLSQTDRVGHEYGPLSLEQLDNLYLLDREVGELLDWLDDRYGREGYLLVLTADHGVADTPEAVAEAGGTALRIPVDSAAVLQSRLNQVASEAGNGSAGDRASAFARALAEISWIEQAWTTDELGAQAAAADSFTVLQKNAHFPGRYTGILARQYVELRYAEGSVTWAYPTGAAHGSPYWYDRHVPFVLFGAGVQAGESGEGASIMDIAPTLGEAAGIPVPEDLDGISRLSEVPRR